MSAESAKRRWRDCEVRLCNCAADSETAANEYVYKILGFHSRYATEKDGGEWLLTSCPERGSDTFVIQVPGPCDTYDSCCFYCGQEYEAGQLEECYDCGELYDPGVEKGCHICSNCFRAEVEKD